jgi:hypothetical protein
MWNFFAIGQLPTAISERGALLLSFVLLGKRGIRQEIKKQLRRAIEEDETMLHIFFFLLYTQKTYYIAERTKETN